MTRDEMKTVKDLEFYALGSGELTHLFRHTIDMSGRRNKLINVVKRESDNGDVKYTNLITQEGVKYALDEFEKLLKSTEYKKIIVGKALYPTEDDEFNEYIKEFLFKPYVRESVRLKVPDSKTVNQVFKKLGV
jgi:hypothetical protein